MDERNSPVAMANHRTVQICQRSITRSKFWTATAEVLRNSEAQGCLLKQEKCMWMHT